MFGQNIGNAKGSKGSQNLTEAWKMVSQVPLGELSIAGQAGRQNEKKKQQHYVALIVVALRRSVWCDVAWDFQVLSDSNSRAN